MRLFLQSASLALRDYLHEGLLSACAALSLAAVLTPLLVLYGVKFGAVDTLTERMRNDPRNLEISPVVAGRFPPAFFAEMREQPGVAFILPRTRSIAATIKLSAGQGLERRTLIVSLEPTAPGDPLLAHSLNLSEENGIIISEPAARKLGIKAGDTLEGHVERLRSGRTENSSTRLQITAVLPLEAQNRDILFVPLPLLEAAEDFRDGERPDLEPATNGAEERAYAGFRLYAHDLDQVAQLRALLNAKDIEVYTKAAEIEEIKNLDHSLTQIFSLIGAAAATGFFASTVSNALAGVKRKERSLGLIRLLGFPAAALMLFPLVQAALTALLGTALAAGLYIAAANAVDALFSGGPGKTEQLCRLLPEHFIRTFGLVVALSAFAALFPAIRASRIEPSEVIRDV